LAGTFNNRPQALGNPAWYVQLRLWIRPIPALSRPQQVTFFLEQASATFDQPPYRQRLLQISSKGAELLATYAALHDPRAWQGAALKPDRLATLTPQDWQPLSGGTLKVVVSPHPLGLIFEARQYPGERCEFTLEGEPKQVELAFDAIAPDSPSSTQPAAFHMYDRGYDPQHQCYTWGARHGPFQLQKEADFSTDLGDGWGA
jgi:hypothetical protein